MKFGKIPVQQSLLGAFSLDFFPALSRVCQENPQMPEGDRALLKLHLNKGREIKLRAPLLISQFVFTKPSC